MFLPGIIKTINTSAPAPKLAKKIGKTLDRIDAENEKESRFVSSRAIDMWKSQMTQLRDATAEAVTSDDREGLVRIAEAVNDVIDHGRVKFTGLLGQPIEGAGSDLPADMLASWDERAADAGDRRRPNFWAGSDWHNEDDEADDCDDYDDYEDDDDDEEDGDDHQVSVTDFTDR